MCTRVPASPLPSTLTRLQRFERQSPLSGLLGKVQDSQEQGAGASAETARDGSGKAAPPHPRLWRHGDNPDGQSRLDCSFRCGTQSSHQLPPTFEVRVRGMRVSCPPADQPSRSLMRSLEIGSNPRQMPSTVSAYRPNLLPFMLQYAAVHSDTSLIADYMRSDWSQDHIST